MLTSDLNREHHDATAEYVRSEHELRVERIKPGADEACIQTLVSRRNDALKRLNLIRDTLLDQAKAAAAR